METMKTLQFTIIKHKFLFTLIVVVALTAGFIFFPRNIGNLLIHNNNTAIEIVKVTDGKKETSAITLDENQQSRLLALFKDNYVRLNVFHKDYVTEGFMGYLIMLPDTSDIVYYFSEDIISINNTQYKVYGQTLADEFKSIIGSGE